MISDKYKKVRNSVAFNVIKTVTLYYFMVAFLLTSFQILYEYFSTKNNITNDVSELISSFNDSLTNSLWEFNDNQTQSILNGILQSPSVLSVQLKNPTNEIVSSMTKADHSKFNNLKGLYRVQNDNKNFVYDKDFIYEKKLYKVVDKANKEFVGTLIIFSGEKVIYNHLSSIVFYIIINSIIKTISLWAILLLIFNKKVKKPLDSFVQSISKIQPENPVPITGTDFDHGSVEFLQIQITFNKLIRKLQNFKEVLEALIENKTEELKERNAEVRQLVDTLESTQTQILKQEKLASLGLLSAGIAHELKNPLNLSKNAILIFKNLVKKLYDDKDYLEEFIIKSRPMIPMLLSSIIRMEKIIQNMLLQSSSSSAKPSLINIKEVVEVNINILKKSTKHKAAQRAFFNIDIPNDKLIPVFPSEFGRLLVNLFDNSFYALNEKAIINNDFDPKISISLKDIDKKYVELTIMDNGIGIPASIKEKILDPFFTTKPAGSGTGLGMYLCYEIVKSHSGEIAINSVPNSFTEIKIKLLKSSDDFRDS